MSITDIQTNRANTRGPIGPKKISIILVILFNLFIIIYFKTLLQIYAVAKHRSKQK